MDQFRTKGPPTSIGKRIGLTLGFYALFGFMAFMLTGQPVFVLAIYLHAMTFVLLGMYVATSAGEVLFNRDEADILLHRPVEPGVLLRARIAMLVQVSLWLAAAFNLAGFFVGIGAVDGGWRFPVVHALSTLLEAVFCTATVVVAYQLCLRWFGREKLDAFMTATQVLVAIAAVLGGQLVPQLMIRVEGLRLVSVNHWWTRLLPPAWFAGIDDALAGSGSGNAWGLALLGVAATALIVWLAIVRLAGDYQSGLQTIAESPARQSTRGRRGVMDWLVTVPPLSWWLRQSVARASFLLVAGYLWRDRDVKLRVYPGIAPILVIPLVIMLPDRDSGSAMQLGGVGFGAAYMALVPMMTLGMLQFSQQWQASDIFRLAPMAGPAELCHGARRAVLALISLPAMALYAGLVLLLGGELAELVMLLPALLALPVFAMIPCLGGHAVPFSRAIETYKGAGRGLYFLGAMLAAAALAGLAALARHRGWFGAMLLGEAMLVSVLYWTMRASVQRARWESLE